MNLIVEIMKSIFTETYKAIKIMAPVLVFAIFIRLFYYEGGFTAITLSVICVLGTMGIFFNQAKGD